MIIIYYFLNLLESIHTHPNLGHLVRHLNIISREEVSHLTRRNHPLQLIITLTVVFHVDGFVTLKISMPINRIGIQVTTQTRLPFDCRLMPPITHPTHIFEFVGSLHRTTTLLQGVCTINSFKIGVIFHITFNNQKPFGIDVPKITREMKPLNCVILACIYTKIAYFND